MKKLLFSTLLVSFLAVGAVGAGGEIYGKIETTRGEVLTGPIRWDANDNFWGDQLNARKTEPIQERDPEDGFRFSLFGWEIINNSSSHGRAYKQFSVPFGHLRSIEPEGTSGAVLELKNGSRVHVERSSSDIGRGLELVIEDAERGAVEIPWRRLARVEFTGNRNEGRDGQRLYGTVTSRAGEFTGFIIWDRDESLATDILDGEEGGRDHEIPFHEITTIAPAGSGSARVGLKSGEELTLRGTNDVNSDNRGVIVVLKGLGTVEVGWRDLEKAVFRDPPASPTYGEFDGGRRLSGKVRTPGGQVYEGEITWDMDESYSWESLDGEVDDIEYSILFQYVHSIKPAGSHGAEVRLTDDRSLVLEGSNDVNAENRGVMITAADGTTTVLGWEDVGQVEFD
jgi:hypothetical protein